MAIQGSRGPQSDGAVRDAPPGKLSSLLRYCAPRASGLSAYGGARAPGPSTARTPIFLRALGSVQRLQIEPIVCGELVFD